MSHKLRKRGKIWHYSGTVAGRRIRGSTRTEDKERAERIAADEEQKAWTRHLDGPGSTLTFADSSFAYREAGKSTRFLKPIEDHWKDTLVRAITPSDIRRSAKKLYPTAGPATWNRQVITPTQAIINYSADQEWCARIRVERFKVFRKIKEPVTKEWAEAFAAHASPHLGALCIFMFATGARIGEAVALLWEDVDLVARTARIRQTKVGVERIAHLPQRLLAAIANIPSNRQPDDRVFRYVDRESVRQVWDNAITRAKIKKLSPHSCRHGFATSLLHAGVDVKTVAQLGGWRDAATVVRTYAHAMGDRTVTNRLFDTDLAQDAQTSALTIRKD